MKLAGKISGWLRELSPELRVCIAVYLMLASIIGWPVTHILMLVTKPAGFTSWTAHVLLAISWLAIIYTAFDFIATTDVRAKAEGE